MSKFQLDNVCSCLLELSITVQYTLVDVHDIETGLSTQILRYFSKEQTSIYNPMCFYAVCYSFIIARNISGIC
jgi:hypothetical protein